MTVSADTPSEEVARHGVILEDEESQNRPVRHLGGQTLPAMEEQPAKGTVSERNHQSIANTLIILFMAI